MGDDDSALWGGELSCSETGYSPECVEYESLANFAITQFSEAA